MSSNSLRYRATAFGVGAALLMAALIGGCLPESTNSADSNSASTDGNGNTEDPPAGQSAVISQITASVEPPEAGAVTQTHLGNSRIQLFAEPSSSDFVFDHWEGVPSDSNPVTIVGRLSTQVTAVFVSVAQPPTEPPVGNDNAGSIDNGNTAPPADNGNDNIASPPPPPPPPPANDNTNDGNDNQTPAPVESVGTWDAPDLLFFMPFAESSKLEFDESGDLTKVTLTIDEAALEEPGGLGGEGEGEGEVTIDAEILNTIVVPGVQTDVVKITIDTFYQEVTTYSILINSMSLSIDVAGDADYGFDLVSDIKDSVDDIELNSSAHYQGSMSGSQSEDGTTISWNDITGTLSLQNDFFCPGTPCETPLDLYVDQGLVLVPWTSVED